MWDHRPIRVPGTVLLASIVLLPCVVGCMTQRAAINSAPTVFPTPPQTLAEIIPAINGNSQRIRQLQSDNVRLSVPGIPISLSGQLNFARSRRFRLSAESIRGRELDMGSNEMEYWLWFREQRPPTVFHGRHDQFYQSAAHQLLPVPPYWIAEALGVVYLAPDHEHLGPFAGQGPDMLNIRSYMPSPAGRLRRELQVDWKRAVVLEQKIYNASGRLLASAQGTDFRHDPLQSITLPHRVRIALPTANMTFDFRVDSYRVNNQQADPELWKLPEIGNHQYRDLGNAADMRGIQLLGNGMGAAAEPESYNAFVGEQPSRRTAWRRMPATALLPTHWLR